MAMLLMHSEDKGMCVPDRAAPTVSDAFFLFLTGSVTRHILPATLTM